MTDFSTTVLREKFVITDTGGEAAPIVALANRFALKLIDHKGTLIETFVVRGQMLHTVVRMAGSILNTFERTGPILNRQVPVNWDQMWEKAAGPYERHHNPALWVAIYHEGKIIFQTGEHHTFLDVIEQCEARNNRDYDNSLRVAEELFSRAGRPVTISHDSSIATTFQVGDTRGKTGLILRGAQRTTTFILNGERRDASMKAVSPVHFINTAAAFLEGIQLSFVVGSGNEKMRHQIITAYSDEGMALSSARNRLAEVNATILTFENLFDVHYRPEKPNFAELVISAENVTRRRLEAIEADQEASA